MDEATKASLKRAVVRNDPQMALDEIDALQSKLDRLQSEIDAPETGWRALWKAEQERRVAAEEQRSSFQQRVATWMKSCFVRPDSLTVEQRAFRFTEEAVELAQACGIVKDDVLRLADYVYGRPQGTVSQEIGGVMVTLAGLAECSLLSLDGCATNEIERCEANTEKIRAKDLAKPERSPLPGTDAERQEREIPRCNLCGQPINEGICQGAEPQDPASQSRLKRLAVQKAERQLRGECHNACVRGDVHSPDCCVDGYGRYIDRIVEKPSPRPCCGSAHRGRENQLTTGENDGTNS